MTLAFVLHFIDTATGDEDMTTIKRDITAGELLPRVGDSLMFDGLKFEDMRFTVNDVWFDYHEDGTLYNICITCESDEFYERNHLIDLEGLGGEGWPGSDDEGAFGDIGFDADSDDYENEFGNDPDDDFGDSETGTEKIKI